MLETRYGFLAGPLGLLVAEGTTGEVLDDAVIYPGPNTAEWLLGMVNQRGSLVPVFADPTETVRDVLYTEVFEPNGADYDGPMIKDFRVARNADYKLIVDIEGRTEYLYAYTPDHPEQQPENLLGGVEGCTHLVELLD